MHLKSDVTRWRIVSASVYDSELAKGKVISTLAVNTPPPHKRSVRSSGRAAFLAWKTILCFKIHQLCTQIQIKLISYVRAEDRADPR